MDHLSLTSLIQSNWNGVGGWKGIPRRRLVEYDISAYSYLLGPGVVTLLPFLFMRVFDQDTFLGLDVQFLPLLIRYMHICNASEYSKVL